MSVKKSSMMDDIKLCLQGYCMGAANVIPGVSGGTIAFLFGIYEQLIGAIKRIDMTFVRYLCRFQFKDAFAYIPTRFLVTLGIGVISAIFTLAHLMEWLFDNHPVMVFSFFFGLILATAPIIARILKWTPPRVFLGVLVTLGMYYFVGLVPIATPESAWFLFLCGAIAICTMILPGISGSFVLLLLGKYQYIIEAVNDHNWFVLGIVASGCVVGILFFVQVISWLLSKFHDITVVVLTGLVVGSLRKIWPWKETLQTLTTSKGKIVPIEQVNILPAQWNMEVLWALLLCAAGFILAFSLSTATPKKLVSV